MIFIVSHVVERIFTFWMFVLVDKDLYMTNILVHEYTTFNVTTILYILQIFHIVKLSNQTNSGMQ